MAQIISASIDLSKIDKAKIVNGKNGGKFYNFDIVINDEPNQYGQDVSITEKQTKEEREAKEKKVYIGNGKTVWMNDERQPKDLSPVPGYSQDLPF